MSGLAAAIAEIQRIARGLAGIKEAPDEPPESMAQFPFVVTYPASGQVFPETAGARQDVATVFTEIHLSRQLLPRAVADALGYHESFPSALIANPTLNGQVSTIVFPVRWSFGFLAWGGEKEAHIGFRFEIDLKLRG